MALCERTMKVVQVVAAKAVAEMIRVERGGAIAGPLDAVDVKDFGRVIGPSTG